jgi:hypothetical protein
MAATATPKSGTKDKFEQYVRDAERDGDDELAKIFRRMEEHSRKGADACKSLLRERLAEEI